MKGVFTFQWCNNTVKLKDKELPPYEASHNRLRIHSPLEKEYLDYQKLIGSGLTTESALVKLKLSEIPLTGAENYSYF